MGRVTVRKETKKAVRQMVVDKEALVAKQCDCCEKIFDMNDNRDGPAGELRGMFEASVADKDGRSLGNMFSATACSFLCAHKIVTGGWKKFKDYAPYAKHKVKLGRVSFTISPLITEAELLADWQSGARTKRDRAERERMDAMRDIARPTPSATMYGYPR